MYVVPDQNFNCGVLFEDKDWSDIFTFSGLVLADNPIPPCELFYFEVEIIDAGKSGIIGVGFCAEPDYLNVMPGWCIRSWGYRGDTGTSFCCTEGAITSSDIKDESLKEKWVKSFNQYRMDEFIDFLVKSLEVNQDSTLFSEYKGYCGNAYSVIGQYEKAIESLTESLKTEPNNVFALGYRAETYIIINKYEESRADIERLLEIVPDHAWALEALEEIKRQ
ncbi:hypothetical protein C2G38_2049007 [Gigaspora rosea]|uniref:Uncharacterized protein n=1 Tax=Gigaspora rosea TaxID=44941 RepID=A0A397U0J0_9GLOM|nr:hypothetical protein C2G38_2049007 [Gigaspora rosea]